MSEVRDGREAVSGEDWAAVMERDLGRKKDGTGTRKAVREAVANRLHTLEKVVRRGRRAFIEVGRALFEIRDSRLYRFEGYKSFHDYCQRRWGWTRRHADRQIAAALLFGGQKCLLNDGETETNRSQPQNEWQARQKMAKPRHMADPRSRAAAGTTGEQTRPAPTAGDPWHSKLSGAIAALRSVRGDLEMLMVPRLITQGLGTIIKALESWAATGRTGIQQVALERRLADSMAGVEEQAAGIAMVSSEAAAERMELAR